MLQFGTRPTSTWTSSTTYNADGRSLPAEFSLSTLQNKLSRLPSTRSRTPTATTNTNTSTSTTSSPAGRDSMNGLSSGDICHDHHHNHHHFYYDNNATITSGRGGDSSGSNGVTEIANRHERRPVTKHYNNNNNTEQEAGAGAGTREAAAAELNISRRANNPHSLESKTAKPVQPTQRLATPLEGKTSLNLPPIRLASSASSSFARASCSPSPSPSPSPSLLPSTEEPHLPPRCTRALSTPTDNTLPGPTPTQAKRCQSQPAASASPPSPSPSPSPSSSPRPSRSPLLPGPDLVLVHPAGSALPAAVPSSLPPLSSDRIGIDNGATAAVVGCRLPPLLPNIESPDGRTSKKRTLEEYQGHSDHFPPRRAPASIAHPLSHSLSADSIPPISLAPIDSLPVSESQPSRSPLNPSVKPVPLRLHEGDLPNRTDVDNSVESTIVLAHRAVTAIKNQTLPRPKTIGPTFTIGKQGSHPFGVAGRPHDGVMESEDDESDIVSTTTTTPTPSPSNRSKMMPWDRKTRTREETPSLDQNYFPDLDPTPISGPILRPSSSPQRGPGRPGIGPLINIMGGSTESSRMIAADVRIDQPVQIVDSESGSQSPEDTTGEAAGENSKESDGHEAGTATNTVSQTIPQGNASSEGYLGDGDGGEDPNDKRSRKLSEHEQDNGSENISSGREKRRRLEEFEDSVPAEPQLPGQADQDTVVSSRFGLSKGPSPPPVPSGPPTVESIPSTTATLDSGPAYNESETPTTMCGASDYYKSPVETTTSNTLPPIHSPSNRSPGRQNMSPRPTQTTLPSVDNLFTVAKHSMDHQQIQPSHTPNSGNFSSPVILQHIKVLPPASPSTRTYDGLSRGISFSDPAQNFRTMAPRPRQSPAVSPTEGRNAPIAPAPANGFPGQVSTSPLNQFTPTPTPTYYPPKNLNRPEHPANHATLPPLQTDWPGSLSSSDPGSARTPTSKKRVRNGTPKNGSVDSSQNSPTAPSGFKCSKEGCTAAPFSTQYLLNSHANVHSEDRPHFCPVAGCSRAEGGKGFKRKNEMIRHGLVHQSPGYVCPFCPDKEHRYPRPDNLQRHVKAHHKDKSGDDPLLREVLAVRPEGGQRGRRRRLGPNP
ncbi:hypothetical protein TWF718_002125 [Orbilia javanica]|uniref:C2H2-type domain-containing protein n=1 Tax=Orbilia javanica TaxID=47235 RepID=A0AAN8R8H7_9PEZI